MSIARKVTEGASGGSGGSDTYVDDVFSTYLYEGGTGTTYATAYSPNRTHALQFSDDGYYVLTIKQNRDEIHIDQLSRPYATDSVVSATAGITTGEYSSPQGGVMSADGTKVFIVGRTDVITAYQYTLSTPYDASTMTYSGVSSVLSGGTESSSVRGLSFDPTGTKLYVSRADGFLHEFTLTTPWSVAQVTYARELNVSGVETNMYMHAFSPDGLNLVVLGSVVGLSQWALTTAWDISTATYTGFNVKPTASDYITTSLTLAVAFVEEGRGIALMDNAFIVCTTSLGDVYDISTISSRAIVNGIDLDDKGGLVWIKVRSAVAYSHELFDTERGAFKTLRSNTTLEEYDYTDVQAGVSSFNSDGFSVTSSQAIGTNVNNIDMASWTFAKQKGFFDVVTYTGDGVFNAERQIPHNLGSVPGMIVVKPYSAAGSWPTYHRSLNNDNAFTSQNMFLNDTFDAGGYSGFATHDKQTSEYITLYSADDRTNNAGVDYIAYIFAHDAPMFGPDGDESIIKCGKFSGQNPLGTEVDLGWEPQFVLFKEATGFGDWSMYDSMRGVTTGGDDAYISPNQSSAESVVSSWVDFNPTGFTTYLSTSPTTEYIYMAIRRPNKPAEEFEPEELFAMDVTASGSPMAVSGFPVDIGFVRAVGSTSETYMSSRLIQNEYVKTNSTAASISNSSFTFDHSNGYLDNWNLNEQAWMFRRAPGFFDVVTYTGDGVNDRDIPHNLAVAPELIIIKSRTGGYSWATYFNFDADGYHRAYLNTDAVAVNTVYGGNKIKYAPTDSDITIGAWAEINYSSFDFIAFLWASVPGICDIGSYTGVGPNGNTQDIDCGFTNGARFVLIKRTDGNGNWMFFDTERMLAGINYNTLALNNTDGQIEDRNHCFALSSGFRVRGDDRDGPEWDTNIDGAEYIYMAIA